MQRSYRLIRLLFSSLAALGLLVSAAGPTPSAFAAQGGGGFTATHPATGSLIFLAADPSAPIVSAQATREDLSPSAQADVYLQTYGAQFGLLNAGRDLVVMRARQRAGKSVVRYQQVYQGVPVVGGELIVNLNAEGGLLSINGETSPQLNLSTTPALSEQDASRAALESVAKFYGQDSASFSVSAPVLWIYDARLIERRATQSAKLVWRVEVRSHKRAIRELVLVDAQHGSIRLQFNQNDTAWHGGPVTRSATSGSGSAPEAGRPSPSAVLGTPTLSTYNSNNTSAYPVSGICLNSDQRTCISGLQDAVDAHAFAYDTYQAYASLHGRDSINGNGMTIISNVNWKQTGYCPNAFWDGTQMVYCANMVSDDVVGHELTHGVTQYESNLFYFAESGAINESLSDVWGEYIDQVVNVTIEDTAGVRWLMGEELSIGAIRNMSNPTAFGDPDSMTSLLYCESGTCYTGDGGGVHYNSGVNNKNVYLMVDGGTFGGKTVAPLGWTKTLTIYYEAQSDLLTSGSGYYELYYALYQACLNVIGTNGINNADCAEVRDATDATAMNIEPAVGFNPNAPLCPANTTNNGELFSEDFETGTNGWTLSNSKWSLWSNSAYASYGPYAYDGVDALFGNDNFTSSSISATSPSIVLPPTTAPYLFFAHNFDVEKKYDGGVLEYSTNGGSSWTDASALFVAGQNYNKTLEAGNSTNPLKGQNAFTGDSHGYVTSLYNFSSLAGQTLKLRWRLGTDSITHSTGWILDNIKITDCVRVFSAPNLLSPANGSSTSNLTPAFDWSDSMPGLNYYQLQVDNNNDFQSPEIDSTAMGATSNFTPGSNLALGTYYWRVRAFDVSVTPTAWSSIFSFTTISGPPTVPTLLLPANGTTAGTRKPTFTWSAVAGATTYKIQLSRYASFAVILMSSTTSGTSYTPLSNLPGLTKIYWRVYAKNGAGTSPWSVTFWVKTP